MYRETHARSVLKAFSWRVLGTLATTALVFVFTRRLAVSLAVGGLEFVSKIALYWLHERVWDRLSIGIHEVQPPGDLVHRALRGRKEDDRQAGTTLDVAADQWSEGGHRTGEEPRGEVVR